MTEDRLWRAVSDPTRRRLIELLRDGPRTTGELCRSFSTSRFAVMKHLAVLERCGLVGVRRAGRQRWNELNAGPLSEIEGRWRFEEGRGAPSRPPTPAVGAAAEELPAGGPLAGVEQAGARHSDEAVSLQVFVDAPPWRVFDALTVNVAAWWGGPHLRSADATNLVLEPQPGGRFYEEWGHRQGALRGIVSAIKQDERLDVEGALFGARAATLAFVLERREGGTLVAASLVGAGLEARAASAALEDLVRVRLKAFVEQGTRSGVAG